MVEIQYPDVNAEPAFPAYSPSEVSHLVKVLPLGEGWCVAVGRGHSSEPISREMAVLRACALARNMGELEVGVYDSTGLMEAVSSSAAW